MATIFSTSVTTDGQSLFEEISLSLFRLLQWNASVSILQEKTKIGVRNCGGR